jgi:hypothetical protein
MLTQARRKDDCVAADVSHNAPAIGRKYLHSQRDPPLNGDQPFMQILRGAGDRMKRDRCIIALGGSRACFASPFNKISEGISRSGFSLDIRQPAPVIGRQLHNGPRDFFIGERTIGVAFDAGAFEIAT